MEAISDVEEREEGEIVEDELDDVSDCSLSPHIPRSGKSVSPRELFRGVSLTSISEGEWGPPPRRARRPPAPHRPHRCRKRRRRPASSAPVPHSPVRSKSSSSEHETPADPKYVRQLRTALKHEVNTPAPARTNPLETRLQLKQPAHDVVTVVSDDDTNLLELRRLALQSKAEKPSSTADSEVELVSVEPAADEDNGSRSVEEGGPIASDSLDDSELIQLRLEALKSVVLTNHERRKLKKQLKEVEGGGSNKENDHVVNEGKEAVVPQPMIKEGTDNGDKSNAEEDLDILFATVLATLSTTLTSNTSAQPVPVAAAHAPKPAPSRASKVRRINAAPTPRAITIPDRSLIKVKPLIIQLNAESDSDVEQQPKEDIAHTVDAFLRKQRAEVEAHKPTTPTTAAMATKPDRSAMKLLPKSQQLEYRRLKQLLIARKRTRLRRASQRLPEKTQTSPTALIGIAKRTPNVKKQQQQQHQLVIAPAAINALVKQTPNVKKQQQQQVIGVTKTALLWKPLHAVPSTGRVTKPAATSYNLKETLDDLRIHTDGRFQMKGKYESLTPLLQRVHHASAERTANERRIKALLDQVEDARNKYFVSHQSYTDLLQRLLREKQTIDEKSPVNANEALTAAVSSTPNPPPHTNKSCHVNNSVRKESGVAVLEEEEEEEMVVVPTVESTLQDPNDVNIAFVAMEATTIPPYISPLSSRHSAIADPLTTFCPYDLLGVCKDTECAYVHTSQFPM